MPFTEADAAKDAARDILLARLLSHLANFSNENPLRWLDREQALLAAIMSTSTGTVERDGQTTEISEGILDMIKNHLEAVLDRARSLQTPAAHDHYQQKLTIRPVDPLDE